MRSAFLKTVQRAESVLALGARLVGRDDVRGATVVAESLQQGERTVYRCAGNGAARDLHVSSTLPEHVARAFVMAVGVRQTDRLCSEAERALSDDQHD